MAKIFLDANFFVDLVERRADLSLADLVEHEIYISPLSLHILAYLYKYKLPKQEFSDLTGRINVVPFDIEIVERALLGPTSDFEDNVQLHSGIQVESDLFFTQDKALLKLKIFGRMEISDKISS